MGGGDATLSSLETTLFGEHWFAYVRKSLVLTYPAATVMPHDTARWLTGRSLERHYHVREGNLQDAGRLVRFLTGRALGVVLGGGGARGLAHLGVLRAFEELDIPLDMVGGNSMGAFIGAHYMAGRTPNEILESILQYSKSGQWPVLPFVSLFSGKKMAQSARDAYGDTRIEDLWTPFFTVSCNLTRAVVKTHKSGPLWHGVIASNSPAGLFPPTPDNGDLLVDAAVVNNVPVDVMRDLLGEGQIVAIDVNVREELHVARDLTELSNSRIFKERLNPFASATETPGILDIIIRASIIGGIAQQGTAKRLADLYLQPQVSQYPLLGFRHAANIVELGYRHAMEELPAWKASWEEQKAI